MTAKEQKKAAADFVAKRVGKKYGEGILERSLFARINPTVKLLLLLVFGIHPFVRCAAEIPVLSSENDFAQWVETNRTCEAISAPLFPPGMTRAGIHLGIIGFNSDSLRELSNLPAETRFDIPVRRVYLCETGAADRVWIVRDANGVPIQEFSPPLDYDVDSWISDAYGTPPSRLTESQLSDWREERDPSRIVPSALLVEEDDVPEFLSRTHAASTNTTRRSQSIVVPSDTNRIALAQFSVDARGIPGGWVYSPYTNRTISVFRKNDLLDSRWSLINEIGTEGQLLPWDDSISDDSPSGFFLAAETTTDEDQDGIPDAMEILAHGTSPHYRDTDGDGLSDWDEINRFGTNPASTDSDSDGILDNVAVQKGISQGLDSDGDGLSDHDEIVLYGTKPLDPDTDGDGLTDFEEISLFGTSPFVSDTDGDRLSDFTEALQLSTNPNLRDTDGDGIDDYQEYTSRNFGLCPTNSTDGVGDYDGDGIPNAREIQWGWSHLSSASSNAVPKYSLIKVQPLEWPTIETDSDRLMVLGKQTAKGAVVRIPRSTQYGTTNTVRRLYYTAAPGIHIGDEELVSDGYFDFPDEMGDVEFPVWADRDAGGTESKWSLVRPDGRTNASFRVAVPKLASASIRLSNATATQFATNLVPGTVGTICSCVADPVYGRVRLTVDPTIEMDASTGHRGVWCTDALLATLSGATSATQTINWLRWDSAHWNRHGIELAPGISRLNVGIDFDLDGILDADEVELSCDVHVINLSLLGDTNRDGSITDADKDGHSVWRPWRGALLATDDPSAAIDPLPKNGLSELHVVATGARLPPDYSLKLHFSHPNAARIYHESSTYRLLLNNSSTTQGLDQAETNPEGTSYRVAFSSIADKSSSGETATLSLQKGISTVASDSVAMKCSPILIPWNTLPIKRLYTTWSSPSNRFPESVLPEKQVCLENSCIWAQDMVETCVNRLDGATSWNPGVVDLDHPSDVDSFSSQIALWNFDSGEDIPFVIRTFNGGNGGNLEATPPVPGFPFGRILYGDGERSRADFAASRILSQGLQAPGICLRTDWLQVGHVDEVCCFIGENTVLVPSSKLAFDLIAQQVKSTNGHYEETVVYGQDSTDLYKEMQHLMFTSVSEETGWLADLTPDATIVFGWDIGYFPGAILYCGEELMKVTSVDSVSGMVSLVLERGIYGTTRAFHSKSSLLGVLSNKGEVAVNNVGKAGSAYWLDKIRNTLASEIPNLQIIEVPVLYEPFVAGKTISGTPNLVNSVVDGDVVYMIDPGCQLFRAAVPLQNVHFITGESVWGRYHCRQGELHCGSVAERDFSDVLDWFSTDRFKDWPYEK